MSEIRFVLSAVLIVAITLHFGGLPWTALSVLALVAQIWTDPSANSALVGIAPSLFWLAISRATGHRELFFPFAMYLATYVALLLAGKNFRRGGLGGVIIVAGFMVVRTLQYASARVLAVELVVAAAILALALAVYWKSRRNPVWRGAIVSLASLIACACLAI